MISISPLEPSHWDRVREIYARCIATGNASFETAVPEWDEWDSTHFPVCRLVANREDEIVGWAALSPVSDRCVYGGVAEVSIYIEPAYQGEGIGSVLFRHLILQSEKEGFWTLQAGIFPENESSLRLHKRLGFKEVGRRERLGKLKGTWCDVLLLERRSEEVGRD